MTEIVKVQRAIDDRDLPALIYTEGRRNVRLHYLDPATIEALGDDLKGYFETEIVRGCWQMPACWRIGKRVEEQPW